MVKVKGGKKLINSALKGGNSTALCVFFPSYAKYLINCYFQSDLDDRCYEYKMTRTQVVLVKDVTLRHLSTMALNNCLICKLVTKLFMLT